MPLYIRDDDVKILADRLAAREGLTITEAVRGALRERLFHVEAEREAKAAEKIRRSLAIIEDLKSYPDYWPGLTDKDLYDEDGNPIL